jgi:PBP1b-binding outer membrane lipoprotein LpoB
MKNKIAMGIVLAILLMVVVYSGCIEEEPSIKAPELTTTPATDIEDIEEEIADVYINGNYKVQDVSGKRININGNYNQIKILNADVSLIRVNGNYNTVYYPKEARPTIKENGNGNAIKSY